MESATRARWWGTHDFEEARWGRWRIGSSVLWAQRRAGEWLLAQKHYSGTGQATAEPRFEQIPDSEASFDPSTAERFVAEEGVHALVLQPALADRPVVSRPRQPLHIMPRAKVTIFASTPLWVQVASGKAEMLDTPVDRPPDTWFGPPDDSGELCYATRISCRLRLEDIQTPPHRAVTAMAVNNDTDAFLHLKHIKLPVPHLKLYAAQDGRIWTEDVTLTRSVKEEDFATVELVGTPPLYAGTVEKLGGPRQSGGGGMVMRAFGSLFS